jgi:hypothetical protein
MVALASTLRCLRSLLVHWSSAAQPQGTPCHLRAPPVQPAESLQRHKSAGGYSITTWLQRQEVQDSCLADSVAAQSRPAPIAASQCKANGAPQLHKHQGADDLLLLQWQAHVQYAHNRLQALHASRDERRLPACTISIRTCCADRLLCCCAPAKMAKAASLASPLGLGLLTLPLPSAVPYPRRHH